MFMTVEAAFMPRSRVAALSDSCADNTFAIRRLRRNALSLLNAHKDAVALGDDDLVLSMVKSTGLDRNDVAAIRVAITGKRYTLICVTNPTWHDPDRKAALLELKRQANRASRNAVLIPATFIQREPRLGNCRAIETAAGMDVSAENRMAILIHLVENGYSTLFDCACVVDDASPFSVVLNLVAQGVLKMDMNSAMTPETRIDLPDAA
jgi:hypothetical protein